MSRRPIRVLCVDDNELVALATRRRLESDPRFEWAGWLTSAAELLARVGELRPDIILLDLDMPGPDALETLSEVTAVAPGARAIVFSGYVRCDLIDRAIEAGAWGYLSKNDDIDAMVGAIAHVSDGEFALSPDARDEQFGGAPGDRPA